jgi:hypothetical protein
VIASRTGGTAGRSLLLLALASGPVQGFGQHFTYVEPGLASCPAPKRVARGAPVSGSISVACGFDRGSYTVSLNSTDPGATFSRQSFIVNFGRIAGSTVFNVMFSTVGVQRVSTTITSNMGSPAVRGYFASAANEFDVVDR